MPAPDGKHLAPAVWEPDPGPQRADQRQVFDPWTLRLGAPF